MIRPHDGKTSDGSTIWQGFFGIRSVLSGVTLSGDVPILMMLLSCMYVRGGGFLRPRTGKQQYRFFVRVFSLNPCPYHEGNP